MWIKLIGCLLVIISSAWTGFSLAERYNKRPREIRQLIACIASLGSHIYYVSLPLAEALERASQIAEGPVRELFQQTALHIHTTGWLSAGQAFQKALGETSEKLALNKPEQEILLVLAAILGTVDQSEQQKQLELAMNELEKVHKEAIAARDQNVKMYRYLGVCVGLATAILLI
ncbi:MAG: spoIIIAB [Firmicutes bacterium]|nr:spoIIIAB [Bacillota bacterium]